MMKLIHLSDLHIGQHHYTQKFQTILDHLNTVDEFAKPEYHIVITGDLINNANDRGALELAKSMIDSLKPRFEQRIFLCPGNHDYGNFWGGHHKFIAHFRNVFQEYLTGSGDIDASSYLPADMPYNSPFPVVNMLDDTVLIGLDTTADELKDGYSLWAEGRMGERQCKALDQLLSLPELLDKKVVLYFHHHPYESVNYLNRFKDADEFLAVIRHRVHMILFGHNHSYSISSSESQQDGIVMALEGGKSTKLMKFRIIDTDTYQFQEYVLP